MESLYQIPSTLLSTKRTYILYTPKTKMGTSLPENNFGYFSKNIKNIPVIFSPKTKQTTTISTWKLQFLYLVPIYSVWAPLQLFFQSHQLWKPVKCSLKINNVKLQYEDPPRE